jgi:hypothetical protein
MEAWEMRPRNCCILSAFCQCGRLEGRRLFLHSTGCSDGTVGLEVLLCIILFSWAGGLRLEILRLCLLGRPFTGDIRAFS